MNNKYRFLFGLKIIAGITFFVLVLGFGTMYLWNWLVPMLFHGPVITFVQAIGVLVLSKILFGFGHKGWGHHRYGGHHGHWKKRMRERLEKMSPEEKEAFKAKFKAKCGQWGQDWNCDIEEEDNLH